MTSNPKKARMIDDEERRLIIAHYRAEMSRISTTAANMSRSQSTDIADWCADFESLIDQMQRFIEESKRA